MAKSKKNTQPEEAKKPQKTLKFPFKKATLIFLISFLFLTLITSTLYASMLDKIYPGISVAGVSVGFLNKAEAKEKIEFELSKKLTQALEFKAPQSSQTYTVSLNSSSFSLKSADAVEQAFEYGHKKIYKSNIDIAIDAEISPSLKKELAKISQSIEIPPIDSNLKVEDDEITVTPSQNGLKLDEESLKRKLIEYLNTGNLSDNTLPTKIDTPNLSYDSAIEIKKRLDQIKLSPIKLTYDDLSYELDLNQILELLDLQNTKSSLVSFSLFDKPITLEEAKISENEYMDTKLTLNEEKLNTYLKKIQSDIDRPVQEPLFNVEQTDNPDKPKIKEFRPPLAGRQLNLEAASDKITQALLTQNQSVINLPVTEIQPKNKLANELGIKELIGKGESNFAGSIPNRIYNVNLATTRINGVIIAPGEEFSFVNTIGDITAATGYKQAYVIKSGRTVLDDGGGVCQVSTTLFRAILDSGLPVTTRTGHAYRVHYYEEGYPPGIDATIFYPSVDLKFKNDSPASILIQAYTDGLHLTVDLYGTSDGRIATLTKPVITSQTPPPPDLRQDDPTLPVGTVKQVDFSAWGANVIFLRTVVKNGETIINESFKTNYRPWQAIYLVGTKTG